MFIKSFFFDKEVQVDGDPELLDDSEFYQQLLKEFFETIDPTSSGIFFFYLWQLLICISMFSAIGTQSMSFYSVKYLVSLIKNLNCDIEFLCFFFPRQA
jgi:hypothetical protein